MTSPDPQSSPPSTPKHAKIVWACIIFIVLGIVVTYNYLYYLKAHPPKQRPPYAALVGKELVARTMKNEEFKLSSMKGKVYCVSYLYTVCPSGCAGIAEHMAKLQKKFASNPKFHLISLTLNAEFDTPEMLSAWVGQQGLSDNNWDFITGDGPTIRDFMEKQFLLPKATKIPEEKRKNEFDIWAHPLAIVLVDHLARIRGVYYPLDDAFGDEHRANLDRDIQICLDEADGKLAPASDAKPNP